MCNEHHDPSTPRSKSEPTQAAVSKRRIRLDPSLPWVLSLKAVAENQRLLVGGKAANLARLLRVGLPVPPGFCITTTAFKKFLTACRQHDELYAMLTQVSSGQRADTAAVSQTAVAWLANTRMPASVQDAVLNAWREQGEARCYAVRSSATAEDAADHSFAGQFASFLNVQGKDALLEAVKSCWCSVFSERALAYQVQQGLLLESSAMAVIVQAMVPAVASGVLFTVDPATGSPGRVVIEAVPGLGDRLVSGRVNPERVVLKKATLRVIEHHTPEAPGCLDEAQAQRLGKLAQKAEDLFKGPQDIEWAVAGGRIFLLQARPVTSKVPARTWADRQVWSNLNAGEVLPDVVTPLTWSLIQRLLAPVFGSVFRMHGANPRNCPIIGRVAGRIYFNVNTGLAALRPFAFLVIRIPNVPQALGGLQIRFFESGKLDLPEEDLPDLGFRWYKYVLSWPRIVYDFVKHSPRRGDAWTARLGNRPNPFAAVDLDALSAPELAGLADHLVQAEFKGWDLLYLFTQALALPVFQKACRDWLDDPDLSLGYRLFAALGGLPETEAGLDLWRLAALAHADRETEATLLREDNWAAVRAKLEPTGPGQEFVKAWGRFMGEHGHHCRGELELFNARWSERPAYILGLVQGYLRGIDQTNPLENQRRLALEREQLTAQCLQRLRNPIKRWIFARSLGRAQKLAVNREVWKNQAVRQFAVLRRILLALGRRLERDGVLEHAEDVFFLEVAEIGPTAAGRGDFDAPALIRQRRTEYETNLTLTPPPVVRGRFDASTPVAAAADTHTNVLSGIPVFPGVVKGRARVILRTDDHEQVLPGEILVAPFTDPAWTPYFLPAAGVVVEQGGILSHGSIVAREYGLPAVTNVTSATQIIRTGDLVQVDGSRGQVMVLQRPGTGD